VEIIEAAKDAETEDGKLETSTLPKPEDTAEAMLNREKMVNQTPKQQRSWVTMGVYIPTYNVMDEIVLVIIAEIF